MLNNILKSERNFEWTIFHLLLGVFSTISEWFLIGWFYIIIISSINGIISSLMIHNSLNKIIPFIIYLSSFEVLGRVIMAYPFIPWELSKYIIIAVTSFLLISGKVGKPNMLGILIFILLIPGMFIDKSHSVNFSELSLNLLGPISMSLILIVMGGKKINNFDFNSLLRLLWYNSVSVLIYVIFETPNYSELNFSLNADFKASGGFGSNQVATILGLGMFLSFYAWMNKLLFSGLHVLDGFFIGLFAYQGFLTFSRGGMIIGLVAILFYYLIYRSSKTFRRDTKTKRIKPLVLFFFAVIILFSSYAIIQNLSKGNLALRYLGETETTLSGEKLKTLNTITTGRYSIIISDLELWYNNFTFGTGAGSSRFLRDIDLYGIVAHTEPTRLLAEHGIFGLLIIILMVLIVFKSFLINQYSTNRAILVILGIIAIGTSLHSAMRTFVTPILLAISAMRITSDE